MSSRAVIPLIEVAEFTDWGPVVAGIGRLGDFGQPLPFSELREIPDSLFDATLAGADRAQLLALLENRWIYDRGDRAARVTDAALAQRDEELIAKILNNPGLELRSEVRERLAATGLVSVLYKTFDSYHEVPRWSLRLRRLAVAASGDELEYASQEAGALVVSRFGSQIRDLLANVGVPSTMADASVPLTQAEQLRGVLSIWEHDGQAAGLGRLDTSKLPPHIAALVAETVATADPGPLRAAVAEAEGTTGAISELRDPSMRAVSAGSETQRRLQAYNEHLELRETLDWQAIRAADHEQHLNEIAMAALASRPDCPADLRTEWFGRRPVPMADLVANPDASLLAAACPLRSRASTTRVLIKRGFGRHITAGQLLTQASPAGVVLEATRTNHGDRYGTAWQELQSELAALVARHLGADPAAWRAMAVRLRGFRGTVTELLTTAGTEAVADETRWPTTGTVKTSASMTAHRAGLVALLNVADSHEGLLTLLDDQTLYDLFRHGRPRSEWTEQVVAPGRIRDIWRLRTELAEAKADPGPHERLAECATAVQHRQLVSGKDSYNVVLRGRGAQLRMFLDAWDRFGVEAVEALLKTRIVREYYQASTATVTDLVGRDDLDAAREVLRGEVDEEESPQFQINAWRTRKDRSQLSKETRRWHWDALLAAHLAEPFASAAVWRLARIPGCPQILKQEAKSALPSRIHRAYTKLTDGTAVSKVLADNPDGYDIKGRPWISEAVKAGQMTWSQVLQHGRFARDVLARLAEHEADNGGRVGHRVLAELMHETIGDNPQAWLLAVHMLPEFPGSVAELFATAATAVE